MCKLLFVSIICFMFMVAEIIGGYMSGSLAIMTDAAHMLSDVAGFLISYFAIYMSNRPASFTMSFGYHRAEVLGALASILLIWGLLIWLIIEACDRLIHYEEIDGTIMLITAVVGLACNLVNIFVLEQSIESKEDKAEKEASRRESHCHQPQLEAISRKTSILKASMRASIRLDQNPAIMGDIPQVQIERKSITSQASHKHIHKKPKATDEENGQQLSQSLISANQNPKQSVHK